MKAGSTDWLSSGGAYWMMGVSVFFSAIFFAGAGIYVGKLTHSENDGCLLAFVNVLAAMCGAGIGFFCAHYPLFVLTTLAGTLALPCASTILAIHRMSKR